MFLATSPVGIVFDRFTDFRPTIFGAGRFRIEFETATFEAKTLPSNYFL
jgi:hypothetical protein